MTTPPFRGLEDASELRRQLGFAPRLKGITSVTLGSGPAWKLGRVGLVKGYPEYEVCDLPTDLMPGASFRKVPFDYPEEKLRGFAVALAYAQEGDRTYEEIAGWVPSEQEAELDQWITFLNAEIRAAFAAAGDR